MKPQTTVTITRTRFRMPDAAELDRLARITPGQRLRMQVEIDALVSQQRAMMFGAPITIERARDEIIARLSDTDRALIANVAEPVERLLEAPSHD